MLFIKKLAVFIISSVPLLAHSGEWKGVECKVWVPIFGYKTVSIGGDCVNGYVNGFATVTLFKGSTVAAKMRGDFSAGKLVRDNGTTSYEDADRVNVTAALAQTFESHSSGVGSISTGNSLADLIAKQNEEERRKDEEAKRLVIERQQAEVHNKQRAVFQPIYDGGRCEDAKRFANEHPENRQIYFDSAECERNRRFALAVHSKDPQQAYLLAVKMENDGERSRAKAVYLNIMDRFSNNPIAMKAADRIASLKDVEAIETAKSNVANAISRANSDASQRRSDYCSGKYSCFGSCSGLKGDANSRCYSSCNSQYSGC